MNLLEQLQSAMPMQIKATATIVGQRGDGVVVGRTQGGSTVLLTGKMENGKRCYYDKTTGQILSEAPNVDFADYPV